MGLTAKGLSSFKQWGRKAVCRYLFIRCPCAAFSRISTTVISLPGKKYTWRKKWKCSDHSIYVVRSLSAVVTSYSQETNKYNTSEAAENPQTSWWSKGSPGIREWIGRFIIENYHWNTLSGSYPRWQRCWCWWWWAGRRCSPRCVSRVILSVSVDWHSSVRYHEWDLLHVRTLSHYCGESGSYYCGNVASTSHRLKY